MRRKLEEFREIPRVLFRVRRETTIRDGGKMFNSMEIFDWKQNTVESMRLSKGQRILLG